MTTNDTDWVEAAGKPAYEAIVEMVSALECDYERLEELRDERADFNADHDATTDDYSPWDAENPDDAEELKELESWAGDCENEDDARERIEEDALSVRIFGERVDGEWEADKFEILLSTGGPAVRIMGELDGDEPCRAWLEVQDWFKPWTQYIPASQDTLLSYCRCYCFE